MNDEVDMLQSQVRFLETENRKLKQSLRDDFAKAALTGLLAKNGAAGKIRGGECTSIQEDAETAYKYGDAMLEARKS